MHPEAFTMLQTPSAFTVTIFRISCPVRTYLWEVAVEEGVVVRLWPFVLQLLLTPHLLPWMLVHSQCLSPTHRHCNC